MDCLFCKIIDGSIPSKTIYEDDLIKVILDINPSTNGDSIIIPKKHYENMFDLDEILIPHIIKVIKELNELLKEKLSIDGLTLVQNNGEGQEIKHYHVHVTPRYKNDKVVQSSNKDILVSIDDVYDQIKS